MSYRLRLLTTIEFERLTRSEQSLALDVARRAGYAAARSEESTEQPKRMTDAYAYFRHVIEGAEQNGTLGASQIDTWRRLCSESAGSADPRVRAFLIGWGGRGAELVDPSPSPGERSVGVLANAAELARPSPNAA